jgi:hypothetical protein
MKLFIVAALLFVAIRDFWVFRHSATHSILDYLFLGLDPILVIFAIALLISEVSRLQILL